MTTTDPTVVRTLTVPATKEKAFTTFTERWDIGPTWQVETDPERTSEVEVRFIEEAPGRTRVELEHRHLDRHGPGWEGVRDGVAGDGGWPLYLARYEWLLS